MSDKYLGPEGVLVLSKTFKMKDNMLDNWYFLDPINQCGQTEYGPSSSYVYQAIDRWIVRTQAHGSVIFDKNGVSAVYDTDVTDATAASIRQKIEIENRSYCIGKTLTASVLLKNGGLVTATTRIASSATTFRAVFYLSKKLAFDSTPALGEIFVLMVPDDDYIVAAKLELGPVQTLAHKEGDTWVLNDLPLNYQQELAKCQRYFYRLPMTGTFEIIAASGITGITTASARAAITLPVPMRINPTISISDDVYVSGDKSPELVDCHKITKVQWGVLNGVNIRLALTLEEAFSESQFICALRTKDIVNQYIDFDANL